MLAGGLLVSETHEPVMLAEIVELFAEIPDGVLLDATLGLAGHATAILRRHSGLRVVGIDQDDMAITKAQHVKTTLGADAARFDAFRGRFDDAARTLRAVGVEHLSGALFDLGVSSPQLDVAERGFSYRHEARLDMRMNRSAALSAWNIVNEYTIDALADLLQRNADERFAKRIATAVVAARPIDTTTQLAEVVVSAIPAATRRTGGHPAKRTFQALRIEVNSELDILPGALRDVMSMVTPGGRIAVLSYHSGEDRIVKQVMRDAETDHSQPNIATPYAHPSRTAPRAWRKVRVAKTPTSDEVRRNPRAASAKLRVMQRCEVSA
ncbi:MAG: 16S rRNA (cytosine(1402)-N(4))-methyltransferase RsmH [Acidimicrobiia bacterium]|nr:16S rRNA (cytosine(1402)-N(4))-methyltransferase RsmH [Acidimicrobiia bacterium]